MRSTYPTWNLKTKKYNRMFASSRNNFFTWRENVKFVGPLEEQVDNMSGGDEDHNGA